MELRTVNQAKIYKLFLVDMRTNEADLAALSYDSDKLVKYMISEISDEPYSESEDVEIESGVFQTLTFDKVFKKGGKFEWYLNTTMAADGLPSQWINESDLEEFRKTYPSIPFIE